MLTSSFSPQADAVSIEDDANTDTLPQDSKFNGDGIIAVHVTDDEATRKLIAEIISCVGSGQPFISPLGDQN
jgi:hypothetical protein